MQKAAIIRQIFKTPLSCDRPCTFARPGTNDLLTSQLRADKSPRYEHTRWPQTYAEDGRRRLEWLPLSSAFSREPLYAPHSRPRHGLFPFAISYPHGYRKVDAASPPACLPHRLAARSSLRTPKHLFTRTSATKLRPVGNIPTTRLGHLQTTTLRFRAVAELSFMSATHLQQALLSSSHGVSRLGRGRGCMSKRHGAVY